MRPVFSGKRPSAERIGRGRGRSCARAGGRRCAGSSRAPRRPPRRARRARRAGSGPRSSACTCGGRPSTSRSRGIPFGASFEDGDSGLRRMRQRATMVTSAAVGRASGDVLTAGLATLPARAHRSCRLGEDPALRKHFAVALRCEVRPMHTATYRRFDRAGRKWCAWKPSGERVRAECPQRPRSDRPCRRRRWSAPSRCRSRSAAAACLFAAGFGLLGGAWLAVARFPGRRVRAAALEHAARAAVGRGRAGRLPAAVARGPARRRGASCSRRPRW